MSTLVKSVGLIFLCLVWGINWVAIKMSLEGLPPFISASFRFFLASIAIVLSAAAAAASTVIIKKYLSRVNTVSLSFHQLWIGTVFLVLITGIAEHSSLYRVQLTPRVFLAMVYMGVIASAAAFLVYYKLLKHMSAVSLSFTIYIIPLVALLVDYLIYGEVLHMRSLVGMIIIFSGIWLSQGKNIIARKTQKRKHLT